MFCLRLCQVKEDDLLLDIIFRPNKPESFLLLLVKLLLAANKLYKDYKHWLKDSWNVDFSRHDLPHYFNWTINKIHNLISICLWKVNHHQAEERLHWKSSLDFPCSRGFTWLDIPKFVSEFVYFIFYSAKLIILIRTVLACSSISITNYVLKMLIIVNKQVFL